MNTENTEKKKGRGRPSGSTNRPKFQMVPLRDLVAVLQPDTMVPVGNDVAEAVRLLNGQKTPYEGAAPAVAVTSSAVAESSMEDEDGETLPPPLVHDFGNEEDDEE